MDIQTKDGILLRGIPDGTPEVDIKARIYKIRAERNVSGDHITQSAKNFANDMSLGEQIGAGAGKAMYDLGQGALQMVGMGESGAETRERQARDKPLMQTGGGMTGNVVGNVAALAPAALIPGANTVAGAAVLGAGVGALQPSETTGGRFKNMAEGAALSGAAQHLGTVGATKLGEFAAKREALASGLAAQNSVRDDTLRAAKDAGYVVPPSAVNPSWINKRVESLAGKAAVGQEASAKNQAITDALARRAATLAPDEAISNSTLSAASKRAAEPYRQISAIEPKAADALEAWRTANLESKLHWTHYNKSGDPAAYRAAKSAQELAAQKLDEIEQMAVASGKPDLVQELKKARAQLAKIHDVERSMNVGSGNVDASVLGRMLDKGAPLTGELETIAKFQQAFPSYAREGSKIPTPGVSKSEALASALLGVGGYGAAGPIGAIAGALPLLSGPARSMALSPAYQKIMANPNYGKPSLVVDPEKAALLARMLSLPMGASMEAQ